MDELEKKALEILIAHAAIEECEAHPGVYLDNGDPEAVSKAYAAANALVQSGEIEAPKEKLLAAIGSVLGEASEECPKCAEEE